MNNKEFVEIIIKYYQESRKLTVNSAPYNIWRGVSHPISSKSEDLFAVWVANKLKDKSLEFIVDKTMSYRQEGQNSIQFRPDLAIIKNNTITHMVDLKMDMGYKRRYHETKSFIKEQKKYDVFRASNYKNVWFKTDKNEKRYLSVSKNVVNQIVVISEKNEGKTSNRIDMIDAIEKLDWINIYYLTGNIHPNNYGNGILEKIRINDSEFERLINNLKTH